MNQRILKKLAKSNKYQLLYNRAKELSSLKLFINDSGFSKVQLAFLYFLELYSGLYEDLIMGKEYINEDIIEDDIRTEAYLLLRQQMRRSKDKKNLRNNTVDASAISGVPTLLFRKKENK